MLLHVYTTGLAFFTLMVTFTACFMQDTVTTRNGRITGSVKMFNGKEYREFLGIPYAKPPVGELRFRKPQPPDNWTDLNATMYGYSCWQPPTNNSMLNKLLTGNSGLVNEDCLTLNVFVPGNVSNNGSLPVMVWIHGGGYLSGTSAFFPGYQLALAGDVIIVTVNYRLGVFGFLSTGTPELPGNYGLWDQLMALEWVNKNTASFGGDSSRVTIFGESAGGSSVSQLSITPKSKGLFQRVIAQSGVASSQWAMASPERAYMAAKSTGNVLSCSITKLEKCLRSKDAETVFNASLPFMFNPYSLLTINFAPVVDNDLFTEHPEQLFAKQSSEVFQFFTSLDFMSGTTNAEGGVGLWTVLQFPHLLPYNLSEGIPQIYALPHVQNMTQIFFSSDEIYKAIIDMYFNASLTNSEVGVNLVYLVGDWAMVAPTVQVLSSHGSGTGSTYHYYFTYHSKLPDVTQPEVAHPPWYPGANHFAEVPYILGLSVYYDNVSMPVEEAQLSKAMMQYWTNFAKTGKPDNSWLQYDTINKRYMELQVQPTLKADLLPKRVGFWLDKVPKLAAQTSQSTTKDPVSSTTKQTCSTVSTISLAVFLIVFQITMHTSYWIDQ